MRRIDYVPLWMHLFQLFKNLSENSSVCESMKEELFYHFSRETVDKQTRKIIIGV